MAAFSYHPFLLDSSFLYPNTTTLSNNNSKMSGFFEEPNNNNNLPYVSHQLYQPPPPPPPAEPLQEVSSLNFSSTTKVSLSSNNSSSLVPESTSMVLKKRKYHSNDGSNSSINSAQSKDTREVVLKGKKQRKNNTNGPTRDVEVKKKTRGGAKKDGQKRKIQTEEAPTGYIHVRARRGQATDSHSLAERVRREKISERMKLLQALVPGCDKVTGKALMLDEIINYVQSLQNQVEFLSMKIASVNPMFYDFGMDLDAFMVKPERMSSLEAPQQPDVQQGSPNQSTTNAFNTANNYPLLDNSTLLQFQQAQMQNILSQNNGQLLWDADEQRQRNISQSSGFTNNLVSFH